MLSGNGREIAGGRGFEGMRQIQIGGCRLWEPEILTIRCKQARSLIREEIAEVEFDVESAHARGIKLGD